MSSVGYTGVFRGLLYYFTDVRFSFLVVLGNPRDHILRCLVFPPCDEPTHAFLDETERVTVKSVLVVTSVQQNTCINL